MKSSVKIITALDHSFRSLYQLYFQTHACHWNVTGTDFASLHAMLGEQYTRLWNSLDEIAERYRVMGELSPTSVGAIDAPMSILPRSEMLTALCTEQKAVILVLKSCIEELTLENDYSGADLLTGLLAEHEKECWMTQSSI